VVGRGGDEGGGSLVAGGGEVAEVDDRVDVVEGLVEAGTGDEDMHEWFLSSFAGRSGPSRSAALVGEVAESDDQPQHAHGQRPQAGGADEQGSVALGTASGVEDERDPDDDASENHDDNGPDDHAAHDGSLPWDELVSFE
jgi:hypothetical protein